MKFTQKVWGQSVHALGHAFKGFMPVEDDGAN